MRQDTNVRPKSAGVIQGFQSPFSGDLDCEVLKWDWSAGELSTFNPRFQGISIASEEWKTWAAVKLIFQSPFSGDLDCELAVLLSKYSKLVFPFNPRFQGISIASFQNHD